jgi:hypothetical protein
MDLAFCTTFLMEITSQGDRIQYFIFPPPAAEAQGGERASHADK